MMLGRMVVEVVVQNSASSGGGKGCGVVAAAAASSSKSQLTDFSCSSTWSREQQRGARLVAFPAKPEST
jgi:tripartite-type tricarboxylate transporter receptor subunit TctC